MSDIMTVSTRIETHETGLSLPEDLLRPQWLVVIEEVARAYRASQWALGDLLAFGECHNYGEEGYAIVQRITGYAVHTLQNFASVSRSFADRSRRRERLSWSHHSEVAGLDPHEADRLLARAEAQGWPRSRLRTEVNPEATDVAAVDAEDIDDNTQTIAGPQSPDASATRRIPRKMPAAVLPECGEPESQEHPNQDEHRVRPKPEPAASKPQPRTMTLLDSAIRKIAQQATSWDGADLSYYGEEALASLSLEIARVMKEYRVRARTSR